MMGWVTERLGSLFRAKRVSHSGEGACGASFGSSGDEVVRGTASETVMETGFEAAATADYATLKERFNYFRETGTLDAAIDSVMNGRNSGGRDLLLDSELLKRIDEAGELDCLIAAVAAVGVGEDAFRNLMRCFGDCVADNIVHDLSAGFRWLYMVENLLACEGQEANECLVMLGAAFPMAAIISRRTVAAVRADPGTAERAKARIADMVPGTGELLSAMVDTFVHMAGATAASHPLSEPDEECSEGGDACGRDMGERVWSRQHRVDHCYDDTSEASVSVFRADAAGGVRWSVVETYSRWGGHHDIHDENVTGADSQEAAVRLAEERFSSLVDRIGRDGEEADDRLQAWEDQQIAEFKRRAAAI